MKVKDLQKVADFFSATLKLTGNVGLAGLKMSDIAKTANLASGTIYVYFSSKENLLNELYSSLKSYSISQLQIDSANPSFKKNFKNIWLASLSYRIKNQRETIFMQQFGIHLLSMNSTNLLVINTLLSWKNLSTGELKSS